MTSIVFSENTEHFEPFIKQLLKDVCVFACLCLASCKQFSLPTQNVFIIIIVVVALSTMTMIRYDTVIK